MLRKKHPDKQRERTRIVIWYRVADDCIILIIIIIIFKCVINSSLHWLAYLFRRLITLTTAIKFGRVRI